MPYDKENITAVNKFKPNASCPGPGTTLLLQTEKTTIFNPFRQGPSFN